MRRSFELFADTLCVQGLSDYEFEKMSLAGLTASTASAATRWSVDGLTATTDTNKGLLHRITVFYLTSAIWILSASFMSRIFAVRLSTWPRILMRAESTASMARSKTA